MSSSTGSPEWVASPSTCPGFPDLLITRDRYGCNSGQFLISNRSGRARPFLEAVVGMHQFNTRQLPDQEAMTFAIDTNVSPLAVAYVPKRVLNADVYDWQHGDLLCHFYGQPARAYLMRRWIADRRGNSGVAEKSGNVEDPLHQTTPPVSPAITTDIRSAELHPSEKHFRANLAAMLTRFGHPAEASRLRREGRRVSGEVPLATLRRYDRLVPFGQNCIVANVLRENGLRAEAFPFDWCGSWDLPKLVDLLLGDCRRMLDDLEQTGEPLIEAANHDPLTRRGPVRGRQCRNPRFGLTFIHYDPITFEHHRETLLRRAARLIELLDSGRRVLLVRYEVDDTRAGGAEEQEARIKARWPHVDIDMIVGNTAAFDATTEPHWLEWLPTLG